MFLPIRTSASSGDVVATPGPLGVDSSVIGRYASPALSSGDLRGRLVGPLAGLSQYSALPERDARRVRVTVSRAGVDRTGRAGPCDHRRRSARMTADRSGARRSDSRPRRGVGRAFGKARAFIVPVPPAPFRLEVSVTPTFSPSQFGSGGHAPARRSARCSRSPTGRQARHG